MRRASVRSPHSEHIELLKSGSTCRLSIERSGIDHCDHVAERDLGPPKALQEVLGRGGDAMRLRSQGDRTSQSHLRRGLPLIKRKGIPILGPPTRLAVVDEAIKPHREMSGGHYEE